MTHQTNDNSQTLNREEHNARIKELTSVLDSKDSSGEQQVAALEGLVKLCPGINSLKERLLLKKLEMADEHKERFTLFGELARLFKHTSILNRASAHARKNRAKRVHYLLKREAELRELLKEQLKTTSRPGVRIRILRKLISRLKGEEKAQYEKEIRACTDAFVSLLLIRLSKPLSLQALFNIYTSLCWAQPCCQHYKKQRAVLAQKLSLRQDLRKRLAVAKDREQRVRILRDLIPLADHWELNTLKGRLSRDILMLEKHMLREVDRTDEPRELADLYGRLQELVPAKKKYAERRERFVRLCEALPQDGQPLDTARLAAALAAR